MKMQIFSPLVLGLVFGSVLLFALSFPFWGCLVLALAVLKIVNRLADMSDGFLSRLIHWIHALVFEAFALVVIWCARPVGYFWRLQSRQGTGKPILLVHGYLHDSSAWIYHQHKLRAQGLGPIYTINLNHPFQSLTKYVEKVGMKVSQIEKETGRRDLILIGHSMGGIVCSLYATRKAPQDTVTDVITIGSPLQGTHMAKLAIGPGGREMKIGSELLQELDLELRKNKTIRFCHIGAKTDEIVIPHTSALPSSHLSEQFTVNDIGHASLLYSPRVAKKLISWIS